MTSLTRLTPTSLARLSEAGLGPDVRPPAALDREAAPGIVHLGIGAFHRAHQAVLTERAAAATGDDRWGIVGVTQRSAGVRDQLVPQGGLYGVLELSQDTSGATVTALDLIGQVRNVLFPAEQGAQVLAAIAAPTTHIVSLTVTEKGYRRGAHGGPDLEDPALTHDLAVVAREIDGRTADAAVASRSAIGLLVRGLVRRWRDGGRPVTVVVCDNLMDNGPQVESLVHAILDACPATHASDLATWLRASVTFPATMVDRIVPATTDAHRRTAERLLGASDAGLVAAEPFMQWVVQDRFAGPRPEWEEAGAQLTQDVSAYEHTKLRLLNGTHSALAYLGALRGHALIADAVADPELHAFARALIDEDARPSLTPSDEVDTAAYRESVLARFANGAIGHTTVQIAMDGSQKVPIRFLATARDRLASGHVPQHIATAVAAWMLYVRATTAGKVEIDGRAVDLDDPIAPLLGDLAAGPLDGLADRLMEGSGIFPADIAGDDRFRAAVRSAVADLAGVTV